MDPLTAFGLAASVVQLVQFGVAVAFRLQEYSASNPNETPKSIQALGTQLPLLISAFDRIKSEASLEKLDFDTRCILKGVVAGCIIQVQEIDRITKQISNEPGASLAVKLRKAFISLKSEERVWAIERNLHTYISVLILHHVVDSTDAPIRIPDNISYFDVREEQASPFFPRDDLMKELNDRLHAVSRSQVDIPSIVVLEGRDGVGKTQLALEYCHQANKNGQFRTVFWLDASTEEALCLSLESVAAVIRQTKEGTRSVKIDFVKKFLRELWHPWLLVLDNYQHFIWGDLLSYLPRNGHGAIILTTRDSTDGILGGALNVRKYLTSQEQNRLNSSLAQAVESKNLEKVKTLVLEGADINTLIYDKFPCLHRAALLGSVEMVLYLLAHGADPAHEALNDRPLWWAANSGHASVVEILLDHDDKTGHMPKLQENNLVYLAAVEQGNHEIVRLIMNRRDITINCKNLRGETALSLAANSGHAEVLKLLLESSNEFIYDKSLDRALLSSMSSRHYELTRILCATGRVKPNAQGEDGRTALHYAAKSREENSGKEDGHDLTKFFLDLGADPNSLDKEGRGPLHEAALHNHIYTLKLLLEHGAIPTIEDRLGYTPLTSAIKFQSSDTASILLDVEIKDSSIRKKYLESALTFASRNGDRDILLSLLEKGNDVDINCIDWKGKTPLLLTVDGQHPSAARLLAKHGARQDIPDEHGRLPLHVAAEYGYESVVRDLVRSSKNPDVKNQKGETALCLAASKGHEKVVELLLKMGADKDLANNYGDTPLELAEENNYEKIVKLLEEM